MLASCPTPGAPAASRLAEPRSAAPRLACRAPQRGSTVAAKKPKAPEPVVEVVEEEEEDEYDEDGVFSCTLVVAGAGVASAASITAARERVEALVLRACQPLLASASQLEEAGFGEEQACVVLGPEEGEVLEGEDEEVPPIFVELLFMTEEACEEGSAKAIQALKDASFDAEIFEDDDDEWLDEEEEAETEQDA